MLDAFPLEIGAWAYVVLFLIVLADGVPFLGGFMPGYLALVAGSVAARAGGANLALVILIGLVAGALGEFAAFAIGRRWGRSLVERLPPKLARAAAAIERVVQTNVALVLVLGRLVSVTKGLGSPLAGVSRVAPRRYLFWMGIGTAVWVAKAVAIGWWLGGAATGAPLLSWAPPIALAVATTWLVTRAVRREVARAPLPSAS